MTDALKLATDQELIDHIAECQSTIRETTSELKRAETVLIERHNENIQKLIAAKQFGVVHVPVNNGHHKLEYTLPKKVDWDQKELGYAVQTIKSVWNEDPDHYVKTEYKVSETAYNAWPPSIRDLFAKARTVKAGTPSIKIKEYSNEEAA